VTKPFYTCLEVNEKAGVTAPVRHCNERKVAESNGHGSTNVHADRTARARQSKPSNMKKYASAKEILISLAIFAGIVAVAAVLVLTQLKP